MASRESYRNVNEKSTSNMSEFIVPPEAPVFYPSEDEFKDPLQYISKIRSLAETTGICKIVPPPLWKPPFSLDVDNFKFNVRIQKLNQLDCKTRVKLNFLQQISKYWELQGLFLTLPKIENQDLDIYDFYAYVHDERFSDLRDKYIRIAQVMGLPAKDDVATALKLYYNTFLRPFDFFNKNKDKFEATCQSEIIDVDAHDEIINLDFEQEIECGGDEQLDPSVYRELKRLKFCGAGPKMNGSNSLKRKRKKVPLYDTESTLYTCRACNETEDDIPLLSCVRCSLKYHVECTSLPVFSFPEGDWHCSQCVYMEISKPIDEFGFEQAEVEYSLYEFNKFANKFKTDYFKTAADMVPTETSEAEYWRIVSSIDKDISVQYGADLHAIDNGSGFPTLACANLQAADLEYVRSGWNLNNLPVLNNSVLRYINSDVSGMKIPWMYVGMCFSTFCWHNEDHWSYSINYLHWGEQKTWYGVPAKYAEEFETIMKQESPELFESQPDLLHQLVTIMNPNILMKANIPVYTISQNEGEFVLTFPKSYHMGFNHGFNFAEAVNFAPADWIKMGRECIIQYAKLRRFCVFSHDELLCTMASSADKLNPCLAYAIYADLKYIVSKEQQLWKSLPERGLTKFEREQFELLPDDKRHCIICKTTCYLSGLVCCCSDKRLVCLDHMDDLCKCCSSKWTLKYRYTFNELQILLANLNCVVDGYKRWLYKVENTLDQSQKNRLTLSELKLLLNEAEDKHYPDSEFFKTLTKVITDVEPFVSIIDQLKTYEKASSLKDSKSILHLDELCQLNMEISELDYQVKEFNFIVNLYSRCAEIEKCAKRLLKTPLDAIDITELKDCVRNGNQICVELPSLRQLKTRILQEHFPSIRTDPNWIKTDKMIKSEEYKEKLSPYEPFASDLVEELEVFVYERHYVDPDEEHSYNKMLAFDEWKYALETVYNSKSLPYLKDVQQLVKKGKIFLVDEPELTQLEDHIRLGVSWLEMATDMFVRSDLEITLNDALCPRTPGALMAAQKCQLTIPDDRTFTVPNNTDIVELLKKYKDAEEKELVGLQALRFTNTSKTFHSTKFKFCVCQRGVGGTMMRCELCKDWFHDTCVDLPKISKVKLKDNYTPLALTLKPGDCRYLCKLCRRTKRPHLKDMSQLLKVLYDAPVRIPEGELLQCMTERCLAWQHRVAVFMKSTELIPVLTELGKIQTKMVKDVNIIKSDKVLLPSLKDHLKKLRLSDDAIKQLDSLLMEADVLEVDMDATHVLWKLFVGARYATPAFRRF